MSPNSVIISSNDILLHVWIHAIIWTSADLLSIECAGKNFSDQNTMICIPEKAFENLMQNSSHFVQGLMW